ncbi:TPA: hypothetical protein ACXEFH_000506 [Staphylococcus aureus]
MERKQVEKQLMEMSKEVGMKQIILIAIDLALKEDATLRTDEVERLIKVQREIEKI